MVSKGVRITVPVVVFWCIAILFLICLLSVRYDTSSLICNGSGKVANLQNLLVYSCILFFLFGVSFTYVARDWEENFTVWKKCICVLAFMGILFWFSMACWWVSAVSKQCIIAKVEYFLIGLFALCVSFVLAAVFVSTFGLLAVLWFLAYPSCQPEKRGSMETSESSPFKVDFIEEYSFGMSIAPGRKKGKYNRDLDTDLKVIRTTYNIDLIASLLRDSDLQDLQTTDIDQRSQANGIELIRFPIRDKWIPHSMIEFAKFIDILVQRIKEGKRILIHCNGGKGRTGTVAVCCLVVLGHTVKEAIQITREARPGTIRNPLQLFYVHQFQSKWRELMLKPV